MTPFGVSWIGTALYLLGLLAVFIGERMIGAGAARWVVTSLGLLAVAAAVGARVVRSLRTTGERRQVERFILRLYLVGVAALLLHFLRADLGALIAGGSLSARAPRMDVVLQALMPALLAISLIPLLLIELSYASMARAPLIESGRVRDAAYSGLGLAFALVFAFAAAFITSERDAKWDLSYFRTAKPGEATRNIVRGLDQPLRVTVFFPPANEVREQVLDYFDELERESPQLKVTALDHAVDVVRARELGVSGNGTLVFHREAGRKELMTMGLELERARSQLRNLDQEVQKRLLQLARGRKTVYFTAGHGERAEIKAEATDQRSGVAQLKRALEFQNLEVKSLGAAQGLASEVPGDAGAVLVVGPTEPFLKEEVAALVRFFQRGGRLLIALDPDAKAEHSALIEAFGFRFQKVTLANDLAYVKRTYQPSDRALLGTATYASHASIGTLARLGERAPMIFMVAGYLEELSPPPAELATDVTVRAHPQTWNDLDGDFTFDPPKEQRQAFTLAAVTTRNQPEKPEDQTQGRAILVADSDVISDLILESFDGNRYFIADGLRWLIGDEAFAGTTNTEEDQPLEHTRKQDAVWFYSSVFFVPALVLGAGLWVTRKTGRKARAKAKEVKPS